MWWIKATIQDFVLRSWSLVKITADAAQKKLFFKLRQSKGAISALEDGDLRPEQIRTIAARLKVPEDDVVNMDRRLRGDLSLNLRTHDEHEGSEALDRLVDPSPTHEVTLGEAQEWAQRREGLKAALEKLSPRERHIFTSRYLTDDPPKLETLALEYGISRERVRQIEQRSFEKVQSAMVGSLPRKPHNDRRKQTHRIKPLMKSMEESDVRRL